MKKWTKLGFGFLVVVLCLASYRLGIYLSMDALDTYSTDSQAMFAFNHIGNYSEIMECLNKGDLEAASVRVENYLITERELLASHLQKGVSPRMIDYIELRSKEGVDAHKTYISNRGGSWSVPTCQ